MCKNEIVLLKKNVPFNPPTLPCCKLTFDPIIHHNTPYREFYSVVINFDFILFTFFFLYFSSLTVSVTLLSSLVTFIIIVINIISFFKKIKTHHQQKKWEEEAEVKMPFFIVCQAKPRCYVCRYHYFSATIISFFSLSVLPLLCLVCPVGSF